VQRLDELTARVERRTGIERVPSHLEATYGIEVAGVSELDRGVLRVDRRDGPSWVARLFPAARPLEHVRGDADILQALAELGRPAERCAGADPVSELEGQGLLVTELVPSVPRQERRAAIRAAGGLAVIGGRLAHLGTLARVRPAMAREGGAWHHLADGRPAAEVAAARELLEEVGRLVPARQRALYDVLHDELATVDDGDGLPVSFIHADYVLANIVATPDGRLVAVDWAGAGQGPRAWALAFLLWSAGHGGDLARVDRVVAGYRHVVSLEPAELERLPGIVRARPVVFECWGFCMGRRTLEATAASLPDVRARADAIAERARKAFARAG
jgi:Ser/Thr protein kinase RdoA (MazF antagonist)